MLAGHYTTALVAYQQNPKGTLLYFLIASQLQDLLWFIFHFLGLEPTGPSDVFNATLSNMTVDMLYSHDLLPLLFWILVVFLIGKLIFKETKVGLIGAALVIGTWTNAALNKKFSLKTLNQLLQRKVYFAGEIYDVHQQLGVPGTILSGYDAIDKLLIEKE